MSGTSGQGGVPNQSTTQVQLLNFVPQSNGAIAVTDASSTALLFASNSIAFLFQNAGTKTAFVKVGASSVVAVAPVAGSVGGDFPILPGAIVLVSFSIHAGQYVAAICAAGETTTLFVTQGWGS